MKHLTTNHRALSAFALLALCLLPGCAAREFTTAWQKAKFDADRNGIEGPWKGTWESHASGHNGELRCVVNTAEGRSSLYDFHYWASWGKAISGDFHVAYTVQTKDGEYHVAGEKDLGMFGGVYSHTGVATPVRFDATYKSKSDHGVFKMTRPPKPSRSLLPPPLTSPVTRANRFSKSPFSP